MDTSSGKGSADENFPVGSMLIRKDLRPHVMCYYNFAREIDDIADSALIGSEEKIRRLSQFEHALEFGSEQPGLESAARLHKSMRDTNVPFQHGQDLISAFKQDAVKTRYENWDDLIAYCQRSAAPVGRYLLDLHGESKTLYPASDALCHALQIINHIQDAADDRRDMDRVYVPVNWLEAEGLTVSALDASQTSPALRRVFNKMLDGTSAQLEQSRLLAASMSARSLSAETQVIQKLAQTLTRDLYRKDPIATRVELSKLAMLFVSIKGLIGL